MKRIEVVNGKKDLKRFIDFPHELYKDDKNYVPELFIAQRDLLTPGKHPFHDHSSIQLFLAVQNDKVIGRIAAIQNNNHNKIYGAKDGFFGFFECVNDQETADLLFKSAENWLKERGLTTIIGPMNPSTNETCALLIHGFDGSPMVMMPYNYEYYLSLFENYNFQKKTDLRAYQFTAGNYNDRSMRLLDALQDRLKRSSIVIRKIDMKNFSKEVQAIKEVYNKAWDKNLGFSLSIPDINQILKKIKRGRLLPFGIFKLLLLRKKIKGLRIMLLGVVQGYRKMGIEACLYGSTIKSFQEKGMEYAEASWTLDDNFLVNKAIEQINGIPYRKYRILEKNI